MQNTWPRRGMCSTFATHVAGLSAVQKCPVGGASGPSTVHVACEGGHAAPQWHLTDADRVCSKGQACNAARNAITTPDAQMAISGSSNTSTTRFLMGIWCLGIPLLSLVPAAANFDGFRTVKFVNVCPHQRPLHDRAEAVELRGTLCLPSGPWGPGGFLWVHKRCSGRPDFAFGI